MSKSRKSKKESMKSASPSKQGQMKMSQIQKEKADEDARIIDIQTVPHHRLTKGIDISIHFKHLEAVRNTQDTRFTVVHYPISIYLGESIGGHKGEALIPFTVEVKTDPEVAGFSIKGEAYIKGSPEEIESWIIPNGEKAPRIWTRIYQESVAMLTILARFIGVPPPPAPSSGKEEENK